MFERKETAIATNDNLSDLCKYITLIFEAISNWYGVVTTIG